MKNLPNVALQTKNQAKVKLVLRVLVAFYIMYLVKNIIDHAVKGISSIPVWLTVLISIVFISSAIAYGFYACRQYKHFQAVVAKECEKNSQSSSQKRDL